VTILHRLCFDYALGYLYTLCMGKLVHGRTTLYNINYHLVWSVKYRREVLTGKIEARLKELLQWIAAEKGFNITVWR
jgi:putative transposase